MSRIVAQYTLCGLPVCFTLMELEHRGLSDPIPVKASTASNSSWSRPPKDSTSGSARVPRAQRS